MVDNQQLLDYLKRVTIDLHDTRARLRESQWRHNEPIAIVGMGCRYPGGVRSPQDLWDLVISERDAIAGFPENRGWNFGWFGGSGAGLGAGIRLEGGFLYDVGEFDAAFFGISPREALAMDPQQRQLLEVAWETLESAGIDPLALRGSRTGVFAGAGASDYIAGMQTLPEGVAGHLATGVSGSVVSGRVSYVLGLEGPAVSVDTACSSSLVAVHLACGALRGGECSLALAGGVTVMAKPLTFMGFALQGGLAGDGRCKSFADAADGTGWAEGVGVVLLERLSDAHRLGHPVLAVVRGSAVNQDGASNGLTAPNGPSQQRVIHQALASAGLSVGQVDVVEAHGTGTTLGDPIEAQALLATYGQGREDRRPLRLGSVKSNIGHTQSAAGVAGLIKMVMAMRHGVLPRTLHVDEPSRQVDWSAGAVSLLTEQTPWDLDGDRAEARRRAGVSSFGISGTNVHMILEEAPPAAAADSGAAELRGAGAAGNGGLPNGDRGAELGGGEPGEEREGGADPEREVEFDAVGAVAGGVVPWVVSGRGAGGLRGQAQRLSEWAVAQSVGGDRGPSVEDVGFSLASTRSGLEYRGVAIGGSRGELLAGLGALATGEPAIGAVEGVAAQAGEGGVVFVFPGQGAQWEGMAVELLDSSPIFAQRMRECEEALAPYVEWSLEGVLRGGDGQPGIERVDVVQPALFAVMVSLARLWEACGVLPDVVLGHSQGEIAAAHVAGGLSLGDAARVVALRSQALSVLAGRGAMASVAAGAGEVEALLERWDGALSVAAVNGPRSVVISGECEALGEFVRECESAGVRARQIPVDYAAHSAQVDTIQAELLEGCTGIAPRASEVQFCSAVTGGLLDTGALDAGYWYRNLREVVQFERAARVLLGEGHRTFIEVGPHPALRVGLAEAAEEELGGEERHSEGSVGLIGSLRRGDGGLGRFVTSLAEAWVCGVGVDWEVVFRGSGAGRVGLPTYAFQRESYWLEAPRSVGDLATAGQAAANHPLLGAVVGLAAGGGSLFTGSLSLAGEPWLADHVVMGAVLLPGTAFLELALHIGGHVGCEQVQELTLEAPLLIEEQRVVQLQVTVAEADEQGRRALAIHSRAGDGVADASGSEEGWRRHAAGVLAPVGATGDGGAPAGQVASFAAGEWPPGEAERVEVGDVYNGFAEIGLEYGPAFRGLRSLWRRGEEIFADVALPAEQRSHAGRFDLHPALLDAALHALVGMVPAGGGEHGGRGAVRVPFAWEDVELYKRSAAALRVRLAPGEREAVCVEVADESGIPVASVRSLVLREVSAAQLAGARGRRESLFALDWVVVAAGGAVGEAAAEDAAAVGEAAGGEAEFVEVGGVEELVGLAESGSVPGVVVCRVASGRGGAGVVSSALELTGGALLLAQAFLADERFAAARMVMITHGAQAVVAGDDVGGLAAAPVWGLIRSAQVENPDRFVLVDIDDERASWSALSAALALEEPQLAIREGTIHALRLARLGKDDLALPPGASQWRLACGEGGTLEELHLSECPEVGGELGPGQIRVEMRMAGLNFRDVLVALGVVPADHGVRSIGGEGAGVVLDVGPGVEGLRCGDRVMGLFYGAFGSVAMTDRRMVVRIPPEWSFVQAAAMPIAFLTAYHALVDLAGVQPGESVLVHAAAGGVGMAAVQLARLLGAEVFATASLGKWRTLEAAGLDAAHIASSRDLAFRERFMGTSGGGGVDVVLNSLAQEFVDASLELLPRGGRFIEMGMTDVRDAEEIAERCPGVSYTEFHLHEVNPERIQQMLGELVGLFERNELAHLPAKVWDVRRAPEAFRFMSQARHVGKIVLALPESALAGGTVLITGGTGGLGALVARRLVDEHGVRSLVLASRSGLQAEGAVALRDELCALGARVSIVACDVGERDELAQLIEGVPAEFPLRGVVHAAGVLDDSPVGGLTAERLERVLAPKVDGAWHLHELTRHLDVCAFVLFSAAAGVLGSPGQGNYAAGNAFLDGLAAYRRARGLPAHSLAWGLWAEATGMTGHLGGGDLARLARSGVGGLANEEGLELFDAACATGRGLVVPMHLDLVRLRPLAAAGVLPPLLRGLVGGPTHAGGANASRWLVRRLAEAPEHERAGVALELVRAEVAAVLGHATPEAVSVQQPFLELGFDSLIAVELRNRLNLASGVRLSTTLIFDHPTPAALAAHLLAVLPDLDSGGVGPGGASGSASAQEPGVEGGTLRLLLAQAVERGMVDEFMELLISASEFCPKFERSIDLADVLVPTRLSTGDTRPGLICIPPVVAISGPHQYAKFANSLRGERDLVALPLPGFGAGERVPASMNAVVEAHAETVLRATEGAPFVLMGYSTGGMLAYALASRLEQIGAPAAGVVLIDSYPLASRALIKVMGPVMRGLVERDGAYVSISDARLTAMGAYCRLLGEWKPVEVGAPTLQVQAGEPLSGEALDGEWKSSWYFAHDTVEVRGSHFTMMEDHAEETARAVGDWLSSELGS